MVALHFTHDFTISFVVESTRRYANRPSAARSPSPPRPRLVNQDGAGCIRATAPFSASPNPLPFLLPDLEPQDPKRHSKAPTRFWNIISPTAAAHHMRAGRVWVADDIECRPVSLQGMPTDVDARPSRVSAVTRNTQGAKKRTFIALHGSCL